MKLNLKIWRQKNSESKGGFENYVIDDITPDMSFLEMMDVLNQKLIYENIDPISFDHDCREGICGSCSLFINGRAHGPDKGITTCQLHMRKFKDGDSIVIEPFRAKSFPIIKDLVVDRSAFDRIQHSGGYISINTSGNTQDANTTPIRKEDADNAFDAATCIGCGACVATCKNASAMLYVSAKVSQFSYLPQGKVEAKERVLNMVKQMDDEGFIYIVDRQKDMYISGGENVYPAEVENVIYQLPEIAEAAIIGVPDKKWGETGKAYIVLKPDCNLSEEDIINHCLKNLAKFKIPASVDFIAALPRNATGKVLKRNLREEVVGSDAPAIT